jgi:hypothetical protein
VVVCICICCYQSVSFEYLIMGNYHANTSEKEEVSFF